MPHNRRHQWAHISYDALSAVGCDIHRRVIFAAVKGCEFIDEIIISHRAAVDACRSIPHGRVAMKMFRAMEH